MSLGFDPRKMKMQTDLAREIEFAINRLKVLDSFTSDELLVQPDLMIGTRLWNQMLANFLRELEHLSV